MNPPMTSGAEQNKVAQVLPDSFDIKRYPMMNVKSFALSPLSAALAHSLITVPDKVYYFSPFR